MHLAAAMFFPGFAFIGLAGIALTIWAIVDVVSRPDWAFQAAGSSKVLWIVLELVGLLVCGGLVLSLIYLLAIRPKVSRAAAFGGPGPAWTQPPPPGWGPPPTGWTQPPPPGWTPPAPPPPPQAPPGWYADPAGSGGSRYWDGARWSD